MSDIEMTTLDNGLKVPLAKAKEAKPKAPTAEEKEAAALNAAGGDAVVLAGEKAAALLNKGSKKTLEAWLAVGRTMVRIGELTNENNKIIGKIIATMPEFSAIPSPIRSNAKWLVSEYERVGPLLADGTIKGDHPSTIRAKWNALKESNQAPKSAEEVEAEEKAAAEEEQAVATFNAITAVWLDGADEAAMRQALVNLRNAMAESKGNRKAFLKHAHIKAE